LIQRYVAASKESPVIVTKNGKPVERLTPIFEDNDLDSLLLAHNRRSRRLLNEARERVRSGQSLTRAQFWQALKKRHKAGTSNGSLLQPASAGPSK